MREAEERSEEKEARKKPPCRWARGAVRTVEEHLPRLGTEVGGFRLEAKLGEGGFGTVYRAQRGGRLYAVKFLYLPAVEPWAWRELEVRLRLLRVGWVAVEGYGLWPDREPRFLFLVMPYVHGTPLFDWARKTNPHARRVAEVMVPLARQLGEVHRAGVVHRDVKGANVLVREKDGQPVLVDFGAGTYPGAPEVTLPYMPPGTAFYRSPEVIRFRRELVGEERYHSTPGDDLWALGVLLYWLLTGDYPFQGRDVGDLAEAILRSDPIAPHDHNPRVPRALSAVCLRMLEKSREARYPDAVAVAQALEAELAGADASWDVPLGEEWGPDNVTTPVEVSLDGREGLARMHRLEGYERRHLRRGVPAPVVEPTTPLPPTVAAPLTGEGAEEEEEPPSPEPRTRPWKAIALASLALLLACLAVLAVWGFRAGTEPTPPVATSPVAPAPTTPEVRKVAPEGKSLEGSADAAPSRAPTPAPVASATLPKEDTRVKTSRKAPAPEKKKQKTKDMCAKALKAGALAASTVLSAACAGTPPPIPARPAPLPSDCPTRAVETMKELGFRIGENVVIALPDGFLGEFEYRYRPVREGPGATIMEFNETGTKLPDGSVLIGELFFGYDRVHGRFTLARTPDGRTYPICMVLTDRSRRVGVPLDELVPGDSPGTARLLFSQGATPVERFE